MNTQFNTIHQALAKIHTMTTGTIIHVAGQPRKVVKVGGFTTFASMELPPMPIQSPNDGRQYKKVHMGNHTAMSLVSR